MRHIDGDGTREDLERAFERVYRRILDLETAADVNLRTSAPNTPYRGDIWLDESDGSLKVWNGSTWNIYQKV